MPATKARPRKKSGASASRRASMNRRTTPRKHNPGTRVIVMGPRSNKGRSHKKHKSSKNPAFFGSPVKPMKMAEYIAGGLIGVTINRAVLPMLPVSITGNNIFATLAAFAIAVAEWWAFSFVSPDFGSAVGFGGLMSAGSTALNNFIPQVGSVVGLSGFGDLVPSQPGLPFWPSGTGMGAPGVMSPYLGQHQAYPNAYGA